MSNDGWSMELNLSAGERARPRYDLFAVNRVLYTVQRIRLCYFAYVWFLLRPAILDHSCVKQVV